MSWRASLAWYDGQISVHGVYSSREAAVQAAQRARNEWLAGNEAPEWGGDDFIPADPVIYVFETEEEDGDDREDSDEPFKNTPPPVILDHLFPYMTLAGASLRGAPASIIVSQARRFFAAGPYFSPRQRQGRF